MPNTWVTPQRDHRLDHHVRHRAHVHENVGHVDVDAAVAQLDGELRRRIGEAGRGSARERVVVVPVPGTAEPALLDRAFPEGPALVRALVVQRAVLVAHVGEHEAAPPGNDGAYAPLGQVIELGDPVPGHAGITPPYATPARWAMSRSKVVRSSTVN